MAGVKSGRGMKSQFVRVYLGFAAVVLSLTALAKVNSILVFMMSSCMEGVPLFGSFQPAAITNEHILGLAAGIEFFVVLLICFSPWRGLPCLACAVWGSICLLARLYFIVSGVDCGCLGGILKPGPVTNIVAGLLAFALAAGGFVALKITRQKAKQLEPAIAAPLH